ncbi:hypothetical protein DIE01_29970 [Burkholderia sp. Bp8990]|nr:hypothetical protein DIE01_29970 [Burkholderia sp. Bp8990]
MEYSLEKLLRDNFMTSVSDFIYVNFTIPLQTRISGLACRRGEREAPFRRHPQLPAVDRSSTA